MLYFRWTYRYNTSWPDYMPLLVLLQIANSFSQFDNNFLKYKQLGMSKTIESLSSSTIKYTTSNILQQIQQGQLPQDQSEHPTNAPLRTPDINPPSPHQQQPHTNNQKPTHSEEDSGEIIIQTVLEKNIRYYQMTPEKKKKKIHKQENKQKMNKQKEKHAEKGNHDKEKKLEKKNQSSQQPEKTNNPKNMPIQNNSSYFNPYMYTAQVPISQMPPPGVFPQHFTQQFIHHNQQFSYPNQIPMMPIGHVPQSMSMPINHNPYLLPGPMPMVQMQIPVHLPSIPINHYKQGPIQNQHKQFNHDKNDNSKGQALKQMYQNPNHNPNPYQSNSFHQNTQNNHNYNSYNFNQNPKYSNTNQSYNANTFHNPSYPNPNYPNPSSYSNNSQSQQYQPISNDYPSSNHPSAHVNAYSQQKGNQQGYGNRQSSTRQTVQPYESQRDKKRNRFQDIKQDIRQQLKQYEIQEQEQLLQALKGLVKYTHLNSHLSYSQNPSKVLSESLILSCYQKNLAKVQKIFDSSNTKSQSIQKILSILELSEIMIKMKQRKLQKIILSQRDIDKTKILIQKFVKDPRRLHK